VHFSPPWESDYASEWYDAEPYFETAGDVAVTAGATTPGINATLKVPGSITGRVTSPSKPGGVSELEVYVYPSDDPANQVYHSYPDETGVYVLTGLLPGDYKVLFKPYSYNPYGYAAEWYNDARSFDTATTVTVLEGADTPGIDAVLERNGSISGRVTGELHPDGIYGIPVTAYDGATGATLSPTSTRGFTGSSSEAAPIPPTASSGTTAR